MSEGVQVEQDGTLVGTGAGEEEFHGWKEAVELRADG
jgi:hypothetical protein